MDSLLEHCIKDDGEELFWWLPLDVYQRFVGKAGEWSTLDKDWFVRRPGEIDRIHPWPAPLLYHQWVGKFQRLVKTKGQLLLDSQAKDVLVHLLKEGKQPWLGRLAWDVEDELFTSR